MEPDSLKPARFTIAEYLHLEAAAKQRHEYRAGRRGYLTLESLEDYVLVSQDQPRVETFTRQGDGTWRFATASGLGALARLSSIEAEIPLSEIYAGIQLPPEEEQLQLF
jgi:Uma2 family endonuclease